MKKIFRYIFFVFFIISGCAQQSPAEIILQIPRQNSTASFADTNFHGTRYISLFALAHIFGGELKAVPWRQKVLIRQPGKSTWTFTVDNPYAVAGRETFNLTYPVRKGPTDTYLPLSALLRLLDSRGLRFNYNDKNKNLVIHSSGIPAIEAIQCTKRKNGALVEISMSAPMAYQPLWVAPHYIINIPMAVPSAKLPLKSNCAAPAKQVSVIKEEHLTQITLYIPGQIDTIENASPNPSKKISIHIRKPFTKIKKPALRANKSGSKTKTIIIDPGHGGKDPGAVFKNIKEKAITLKVALALRQELKKRAYKVLLTRDTDKTIPLSDRPKFAADRGGDLFISLHCNAIDGTPRKKKRINGFVAYILRAGKSEEDKALARRENQAVIKTTQKKNKTEISPVEWILLEHELNLYSHQSEFFAEKIVHAFKGCKIKKHRTGAHQAGFFVLAGSFMPAVLFEMGFITNHSDRKIMNSSIGQKDIAVRLAKSIDNFFKSKKN